MAARPKKLDADGLLHAFGADDKIRVERNNPLNRDDPVEWRIYRKVDVTDDPDTTYTYRFREVDRFTETELGVAPEKAITRAEALAGKGE